MASAGSFLDGGGSKPLQRAAIPLLADAHAIAETEAIHDVFGAKRERMLTGLARLGIETDRAPDGTFYVWGRSTSLPAPLNDGMGFFRAALDHQVIVVPGEFFDVNPGKRRHQRDSLPPPRPLLLRPRASQPRRRVGTPGDYDRQRVIIAAPARRALRVDRVANAASHRCPSCGYQRIRRALF